MSTAPRNQDALRWDSPKQAPRQPEPGDVVWELRKGIGRLRCELRGHGDWAWETQLLLNEEFYAGRRVDLRAQAVAYAAETKRWLIADEGWTGVRR